MKLTILAIFLPLTLLAAGCNTSEQPKTESIDPQQQVRMEENHKKFEAYKQELGIICVKKVVEMTGIELAKCKEYKDNVTFYELFGGRASDTDFSYLPEVCKRTLKELNGNEMIDCLAEEPESDIAP